MAIDLTIDADMFLADFGESITITAPDGSTRTITAIVDRGEGSQPEAPGMNGPVMQITVKNHATEGILPSEDVSGFEVLIAIRDGDETESRVLGGITSQDAGLLTIEVR